MSSDEVVRLRLLQRFEQLTAGLTAGDRSADEEARSILRRVLVRGSTALLAQVFLGIMLSCDDEQAEWERSL